MILKHIYAIRVTFFTFLALCLLSSCVTVSSTSRNSGVSTDELLANARQAQGLASPQRENKLLDIAEALAKKNETNAAESVTQAIDPNRLNNVLHTRYTYVMALIYEKRGNHIKALELISSPRMETYRQELPVEHQQSILFLKASINGNLGDIEESVKQRTILSTLLLPNSKLAEKNDQLMWQDLIRLPERRLVELANKTRDRVLAGWFERAAIHKRYAHDPKAREAAVQRWAMANPNHPASRDVTVDPRFTGKAQVSRPQKVALLLPLEGELSAAGQAIRDGFMSAYKAQGSSVQVVSYNTNDGPITSIYSRAVADGADMVIGPLTKDRVMQLSQLGDLPVTTLALNYIDRFSNTSMMAAHPNFFQYSLAPEDEGKQIAEFTWQEGHRSAIIIRRKSDWSPRAAGAFIDTWRSLGGEIAEEHEYSDENLAQMVKQVMQFNKYRKGRTTYRTLPSGLRVAVQPRRRNDADLIVMMSSPIEGRQIIPALDYYFAKDIPVYATRHVYADLQFNKDDSDMKGVRFTAIPWAFIKSEKDSRGLLHAMGMDAFLLQESLGLLIDQGFLQGMTGRLTMQPDQRIERRTDWGVFNEDGKVVRLPASTRRLD